MNLPPPRRHGLRFSIGDAVILIVGVILAWWLHSQGNEMWWIVPVAVGHFFLFCNVFMVWRRWEMLWAGALVLNVLFHAAQGQLGWWPACGWQVPVTLLVIGLQMRSPWYHGVWAERVNPRLRDYLDGRLS
ncbi:hypothetical protein WJU23_22350 [Prosthecobacter sp. SYSU 5D2]|uniref:hypothetical protein n=1 Tax=Prosthecobacter sp. SYSU 5D2 TaxID=3134134 RepID=UPI0031FF0CB2